MHQDKQPILRINTSFRKIYTVQMFLMVYGWLQDTSMIKSEQKILTTNILETCVNFLIFYPCAI